MKMKIGDVLKELNKRKIAHKMRAKGFGWDIYLNLITVHVPKDHWNYTGSKAQIRVWLDDDEIEVLKQMEGVVVKNRTHIEVRTDILVNFIEELILMKAWKRSESNDNDMNAMI